MSKTKIASVSYLNSIPFTYGIEHSGMIDAELTLTTPSRCTAMLRDNEVDIALIPVAALTLLGDEFEVITSHCIGATGAVRTVALMSDEPLSEIKRIWLDSDSQTSVKLLAHLCDNHFRISPDWHSMGDLSRTKRAKDGDAFLLIGDKVFEHEGLFDYTIDLAEEWVNYSGTPFVFAVWCCRRDTDPYSAERLEEALTWGVEHTYEALTSLRPDIEAEDGYRYLTENIDTLLDSAKRHAMDEFLSSESKITLTRGDENN